MTVEQAYELGKKAGKEELIEQLVALLQLQKRIEDVVEQSKELP